jgi:hypothetical protein
MRVSTVLLLALCELDATSAVCCLPAASLLCVLLQHLQILLKVAQHGRGSISQAILQQCNVHSPVRVQAKHSLLDSVLWVQT